MEEETILHFKEQLAEGYDLVHDPLYNVWSKLKRAVLKSDTTELTSTEKDNSNPIPEFNKLSIAPAFQEELKHRYYRLRNGKFIKLWGGV